MLQAAAAAVALAVLTPGIAAEAAARAVTATPPVAAPTATHSQQQKMTSCNADASAQTLKGPDRKAFMKTCLSANSGAGAVTQQDKMKTCNAAARDQKLTGTDRRGFMSNCLKAH